MWRRPEREVPVEPLSLLRDIVDGKKLSPRMTASLRGRVELKRAPLIDPDVRRHGLGADKVLLAAEEKAEREGLRSAVHGMLRSLPSRERAVIRLRYGISGQALGVGQTAERLGYSRTSIWAIERRALERLAVPAAEVTTGEPVAATSSGQMNSRLGPPQALFP